MELTNEHQQQINNHWLIRVKDGKNFKNSVYPFWDMKRGHNGCIKTIVGKIKKGDILWFFTSKQNGGIIIGMAEFTHFFDRSDEPLIKIRTISNVEQGWDDETVSDLQIYYTNLYNTEKQKIKVCLQHSATLFNYKTMKDKIQDDLVLHYNNFKFYAEPKTLKELPII